MIAYTGRNLIDKMERVLSENVDTSLLNFGGEKLEFVNKSYNSLCYKNEINRRFCSFSIPNTPTLTGSIYSQASCSANLTLVGDEEVICPIAINYYDVTGRRHPLFKQPFEVFEKMNPVFYGYWPYPTIWCWNEWYNNEKTIFIAPAIAPVNSGSLLIEWNVTPPSLTLDSVPVAQFHKPYHDIIGVYAAVLAMKQSRNTLIVKYPQIDGTIKDLTEYCQGQINEMLQTKIEPLNRSLNFNYFP